MAKTLLGKVALTPKGVFDENKEGGYARLDVVTDGTQSYVSLKDDNHARLDDPKAWMQYMNITVEGGGGSQPSSGVTEIDYSNNLMEGNWYLLPPNFTPTSSSNSYVTTNFIPVEPGDHVIFTGDRNRHVPFIVGYDSTQQNPQELLGDTLLGSGTSNEEVRVRNYDLTIPSGVYFIRCCARGEGRDGAPKMVVKVRNGSGATNTDTTPSTSTVASSYPTKAFVPDTKKILIVGASFAAGNDWAELLKQKTGIPTINLAKGSTSIINNVAARLMMRSANLKHGWLFSQTIGGKDLFNDIGVIIVNHTHNQDVFNLGKRGGEDVSGWTADDYESYFEVKSKDSESVTSHYSLDDYNKIQVKPKQGKNDSAQMTYAEAFDYFIKRISSWNKEYIEADTSTHFIYPSNTIQILITSHWTPGRKTYNKTSRQLAEKHKVAYCELDTMLGFKEGDDVSIPDNTYLDSTHQLNANVEGVVTGLSQLKGNTMYNRSVLHAKDTDSDGNNGPYNHGDGEKYYWGLHPKTSGVSTENIDFGYGDTLSWKGHAPWIQHAWAQAIISCLNYYPIQEIN